MTETSSWIAKVSLLILGVLAVSVTGSAQLTGNVQTYIVSTDGSVSTGSLPSGVEVVYDHSIIDGYTVRMPSSAASATRSVEGVESVELDVPVLLPVMPGDGDDTERDSYNASGTVAVLDTGVDDSHVDLDSQVISNEDVRRGESNPDDLHGHGTHVASILAGTGDADGRYRGVAPGAQVRNYKVLGDSGRGKMSTVIEGIERASKDSDVIVLSLGAEVEACDGSDPLSRAVTEAAESGTAVVVATGNSGPEGRTINSPGCAHKAFSIGASSGRQDVPDYSSRGPTDDGRTKPDLVAPGSDIVAAEAQTRNEYTSKTGTSMSAPYAAGAVTALMDEKERGNARYYKELEDTAFSLGEDGQAQGSGHINLTAALSDNNPDNQKNDPDQSSEEGDENKEDEASGRGRSEGSETEDGGNKSGESEDSRNEDQTGQSGREGDASDNSASRASEGPLGRRTVEPGNQPGSGDEEDREAGQRGTNETQDRRKSREFKQPAENRQKLRKQTLNYLRQLLTSLLQGVVSNSPSNNTGAGVWGIR